MKLKRLSIVFLIVLCTLIFLGVVSAAENTKVVSTSSNSTTDVVPVETDVDADDVVVPYKKKAYFKVKVEDDNNDRPLKNLKVKLKVFTKSKSKTYVVKTNSKGIVKFNTKDLSVGKHKVIVTSEEAKYPINEKANIYVGKIHKSTLKVNSVKKLKNKDKVRVYTKLDDDEKEVKVAFKGTAKHTYILKATFYFKDKSTGRVIVKTDKVDFDDGRWELPDEDCSLRYTPTKVKIEYINA